MDKGSKSVVCAREGGANTTSLLAAHFAKRNTKNCGGEKRSGESEGGQKFLPPNPLPFCPPEHSVWRAKRAINSVQKRFGFRQTNALECAKPKKRYTAEKSKKPIKSTFLGPILSEIIPAGIENIA